LILLNNLLYSIFHEEIICGLWFYFNELTFVVKRFTTKVKAFLSPATQNKNLVSI